MIAFDRVVVRYPASRAGRRARRELRRATRGRMTAIVGPNGSGKSTLVRALLGRQPLVSGRIAIDGAGLGALSRDEVARRVAVVTQREELAFPPPRARLRGARPVSASRRLARHRGR